MPDISNYPQGLLSLLGAQNFGETVKNYPSFVQPVLETRDLFAANYLTTVQGNGNVGVATDFPASLTVPAAELWHIRAGSLLVQSGAGVTATNVLVAMQFGGVSGNSLYVTTQISVPANNVSTAPFQLPNDIWLTSGSRFGVVAGAVVLVPTYVVTLLIERYRA